MRKLLLLSSDDRRRYVEDIQTALASPDGALIQFRYREQWVTSTVQRAVPNHGLEGADAILGFVADVTTPDPFMVPIRYARITEAAYVADMCIFKLRIGGYVDLAAYPKTLQAIVDVTRSFIDTMKENESGVFHPVTSSQPLLPEEVKDDVPASWLAAARRLAVHPTFKHSYFLRVDPVETHTQEQLRFSSDGRIEAVDGHSLRVVANFFGEQYAPDAQFKLTCSADGTNLRVASDETYDVELRYDSVEFWLHPAAQKFDTLSRVTVSLTRGNGGEAAVPAHVRIPLVVKPSKSRLVWRVLTTGLGAALVAFPAIIGTESLTELRIAAGVAGAALLAYGAAVFGSSK